MGYGFGRVNDMADEIHKNAKEKGFYNDLKPNNARHILSQLMLIVTEVAEAAEAVRIGDTENFAEELADIIIRTLDTASSQGINIEQEIVNKMEKNRLRERRHGGKRA